MAIPILDVELIKAACGEGDLTAVTDLADTLLSNAWRRQERLENEARRTKYSRREHGLKHGDIPDQLINNFAYGMVKACTKRGSALPDPLVRLLQRQLRQDRRPSGTPRRYVQQLEARRLVSQRPTITDAAIARKVGVHRSTVGRWRKDGLLQ